jgi:hypothetical protein
MVDAPRTHAGPDAADAGAVGAGTHAVQGRVRLRTPLVGLPQAGRRRSPAWEAAGRDPKTLQVVPYAVRPSAGKLAHYAELGVEEVVLQLPPGDEPEVLRALDEYAQYL